MSYKIECPECKTEYTPERLGIPALVSPGQVSVDVKCMVCKKAFHSTVVASQTMWNKVRKTITYQRSATVRAK